MFSTFVTIPKVDDAMLTPSLRMARIKQVFDVPPPIEDLPSAVSQALSPLKLTSRIRPGETVAITVGSRGIANIATIVRAVIAELKSTGATPFILPAMGSHGGATIKGQIDVLRQLGVTPETMGVPIRATMEVTQIGKVLGFPVYINKFGSKADHIAVVARIKPHTDFKGDIESGFYKMMVVGLGNHKGATAFHRASARHGHSKVLAKFGRTTLKNTNIAFGLGIVENAYDQTVRIEAASPSNMEQTEKKLLRQSKSWMMKLPFNDADVLIVDELGKDISGDGMDPNVTGRFGPSLSGSYGPRISRIVVLDLTHKTHGNALGIGKADFTTKRAVEKMDRHLTYINALTALDPAGAKIPPYFDNDRETVSAAVNSILTPPNRLKAIRIKNTLALGEVEISEAYLPLLKNRKDLFLTREPKRLTFDRDGNLPPFQFQTGLGT